MILMQNICYQNICYLNPKSENDFNAKTESVDESFEKLFDLSTMALVENVSGLTLTTIVENISAELKSLKGSERREVALFCVACAIGNRKLASKYISECVKKIIAKEIFVINATFEFSVFAILGKALHGSTHDPPTQPTGWVRVTHHKILDPWVG
jgi:hypothetical protein